MSYQFLNNLALSEQQFDLDLRGVAVLLRDLRGDVVGGGSVIVPIKGQLPEDAVKSYVPV